MKKLSGLERSVLLLTATFFIFTCCWFFFENRNQDLVRVEVSRPEGATQAEPVAEQDPAPGILDGERININTASAEDLTRLPGIGQVKAGSIVEYRQANGSFESPEELMQVSGIGEATLNKLLPYICVETKEGEESAEDSGGG